MLGAAGQTKRPPIRSAPLSGFSAQPFDLAVEKLLPGFKGHDAAGVVVELTKRKAAMVKDEFETTAAYRERMAGQAARPLLGTLRIDKLFAFVLPASAVKSTYDADDQVLSVSLPVQNETDKLCVGWSFLIDDWKCKMFALVETPISSTSYIGENAFGVKRRVTKKQRLTIGLGFAPQQPLEIQDRYALAYVGKFAATPEAAVSMKSNLRAVVIGPLNSLIWSTVLILKIRR